MEHDTGPEQEPTAPGGPTADGPDEPATDERPATGEPRVDAALGRLGELDELPVTEYPQVYERIHTQLVEVLGELHSGPGPAAPTRPPGPAGSAEPTGLAAS